MNSSYKNTKLHNLLQISGKKDPSQFGSFEENP